jgi:hypothetical protein
MLRINKEAPAKNAGASVVVWILFRLASRSPID